MKQFKYGKQKDELAEIQKNEIQKTLKTVLDTPQDRIHFYQCSRDLFCYLIAFDFTLFSTNVIFNATNKTQAMHKKS